MKQFPNQIAVSKKWIEFAVRSNSGHCIIAEALKELGAKRVSVDVATIRFTYDGTRRIHLTHPKAQVALVQYDQGIPLEPFTFSLGRPAFEFPEGYKAGSSPAKLKFRKPSDETSTSGKKYGRTKAHVPTVVGGKAPPRAALSSEKRVAGKIRRFGLRSLG